VLSKSDLHEYQHRAIDFIKSRKRCGLALSMGLGKTTSTLTAISDLSDSFIVSKVLVIAPLRVANSVWKQEAKKWDHLKGMKISICTGNEKARMAALQAQADVYVINRENVKWLTDLYKKRFPFDCVVVDESSSFKNASSQRWKALKKILHETDYFILLTGTPAPNGLLDMWSQQYLVDFGLALGRTMSVYKHRFFESDYMGYSFSLREGSAEKIHKLLEQHWLSMSAEDYLNLPECLYLVEQIVLAPNVIAAYKDFENNMFAQLITGEEIEPLNAAVLAGRLLQWASGSIYTDDKKNYAELHSSKLDTLSEIVEDNAGENILVAYNFKSDLDRLIKRFPKAVVLGKDASVVDRWNKGEIAMLLAQPMSAGHGINLQGGGCIAIWYGLSWSLEYYLQFNARLHRQGQTKPVRIIHLIAQDTIDERVMSVLASKDVTQNKLLSALKRK